MISSHIMHILSNEICSFKIKIYYLHIRFITVLLVNSDVQLKNSFLEFKLNLRILCIFTSEQTEMSYWMIENLGRIKILRIFRLDRARLT